jgi:hypothetical protein
MALPGSLIDQIKQNLLDSFEEGEFKELLRIRLNENLDDIVADEENRRTAYFATVMYFERRGELLNLLQAAKTARPNDPAWDQLIAQVRQIPRPSISQPDEPAVRPQTSGANPSRTWLWAVAAGVGGVICLIAVVGVILLGTYWAGRSGGRQAAQTTAFSEEAVNRQTQEARQTAEAQAGQLKDTQSAQLALVTRQALETQQAAASIALSTRQALETQQAAASVALLTQQALITQQSAVLTQQAGQVKPPRIINFLSCVVPCEANPANNLPAFPEKTAKLWYSYRFENLPKQAHYERIIIVSGREWAHYDCVWTGPATGVDQIILNEPEGLTSGTWEITIKVNQIILLKSSFLIQGGFEFWNPPGNIDKCYGPS